jgi:ATP-dependent Lon protease
MNLLFLNIKKQSHLKKYEKNDENDIIFNQIFTEDEDELEEIGCGDKNCEGCDFCDENNKNYDKDDEDDDYDEDEDDDDEKLDALEYRKLLKDLFPSKYIDKKILKTENIKQILSEKLKKEDKKEKKEDKTQNLKKDKKEDKKENLKKDKKEKKEDKKENLKKDKKEKKEDKIENLKKDKKEKKEDKIENLKKDKKEDKKENLKKDKKENEKINIILNINNDFNDDEEYDSEWESSSYDDTSSDDSKTENEDDEILTSSSEDSYNESINSDDSSKSSNTINSKTKNKNIKKEKTIDDKNENEDLKINNMIDLLNKIKNKNLMVQENNKYNDATRKESSINKDKKIFEKSDKNILNECIVICKEEINKINKINKKNERKLKKEKERNIRIFKKLNKSEKTLNDRSYFKKLDIDNQKKIIKEIRKINDIIKIEKPYKILLLESEIPYIFKSHAFKKINLLKYMEPGTSEYYKIKNWVDTFMSIPFGIYKNMDISIDHGIDKCHSFMENAKVILDSAVYGLNDAKLQIMQYLGQLITNPSSIGTSIAIHGVPGSGKTTLLKEGVSKILNRPFAFIALGGATDSSFLEGHSYTYEGSIWGKIVQILIDSKCMNPVIYFDELDKISETPKGEEILNILVHLTDTSQNNEFHDKYFSEVNFDLSRCLFIFSYNDESKISPILLDRMYKIKTDGYSNKEKIVISNNYLLPKIREQIKFDTNEIIIDNEVLSYIIEKYTSGEKGVRNIKRCLEIVYSKLNLFRLMKPNTNLFINEIKLDIKFPCNVTKNMIDSLLKQDNLNIIHQHMYI